MKIKYDTIGIGYDQCRKADPYLTQRLLHHLHAQAGQQYLDIGCGTGNYTTALYQPEYKFLGIDPSGKMLEKARKRNKSIDWRTGDAEHTGLEDQSIDGIVATLTIHHWPDLEKGFREAGRILRPGGRMVIFTSTPEQMESYWLCHYFPKMLKDSILQMPPLEKVIAAMKAGGISVVETENYEVHPELEDHFLYCGKERPGVYLKEEIRNGISSFSSLANKGEVEKGLAQLRLDMENGTIDEIMRSYKNSMGDYLFITGIK